jgi:solute carrier family 35, member F5
MSEVNETEDAGLQHSNHFTLLLSDYGLGVIYLLAVILLWTTSNFITQDLYTAGYNKPFL